jgi:wobble nucleotide-excising tRNase
VNIEGETSITQRNIDESDLNIYTFNQDFIDENISWHSVVKSILIVDKAKIKEREKLEELNKAQKNDLEVHSREADEIRKLDIAVSKFGTDSARHMKTSLQSIDTTDRYYLNCVKRKFEAVITDNLEAIKEKIYRFINKYSHSVVIEINEDSSENLVGESQNVIGDIFNWLMEVDEVHYREMLEVVQ